MASDSTPKKLNKISSRITQQKSQGASQAQLYATGLTEADMDKAQVGISSVWYEGNSVQHAPRPARGTKSRKGVDGAGLVGMRFNTIGVSDGMSMGTTGMSFSLQSRDLIADSIETVMGAQWYDANVSIPGCDKNMPGCLMAMARVNRPVAHGVRRHDQAGKRMVGKQRLTRSTSCRPSSATASSSPATSTRKSASTSCARVSRAPAPAAACTPPTRWHRRSRLHRHVAALQLVRSRPRIRAEDGRVPRAGEAAVLNLLELDIKPRDIMTREAFENAMVIIDRRSAARPTRCFI